MLDLHARTTQMDATAFFWLLEIGTPAHDTEHLVYYCGETGSPASEQPYRLHYFNTGKELVCWRMMKEERAVYQGVGVPRVVTRCSVFGSGAHPPAGHCFLGP